MRAATIRTAIASILGQSCSDWELIVVGQGHRDELQTAQHWWSYLSSQNRRVSLVQNLAIRALPRARMLFKLDDDVFIVERFYCSRIMTVVHNVSAVHFSFGAQDQTMRSMFGDRLAQF